MDVIFTQLFSFYLYCSIHCSPVAERCFISPDPDWHQYFRSAGSFAGNSEEIPIDDVDELEELEEAHDGMLEMSVIQKFTHW